METQLQEIQKKCPCSKFFTLARYGLSIVNCLVMVAGCCMAVIASVALQEETLMSSHDNTPPNPSVFMLVLGVVMLVVGSLGCLSLLRDNIVLLRCFGGSVMVMFVLEVTAGALTFLYLRAVTRSVSDYIMDAIVIYQDQEMPRDTVDYIQMSYNCCGSESYVDWEKNQYYECSSVSQASCGVPPSCCKVRGSLQCGFHTRGYGRLYAAHSIYTEGCVHSVVSRVRDYLIVIGSIGLGVGCIEVLSLAVAGILIKNILVSQQQSAALETNSKYYSDDEQEEPQLELKSPRDSDAEDTLGQYSPSGCSVELQPLRNTETEEPFGRYSQSNGRVGLSPILIAEGRATLGEYSVNSNSRIELQPPLQYEREETLGQYPLNSDDNVELHPLGLSEKEITSGRYSESRVGLKPQRTSKSIKSSRPYSANNGYCVECDPLHSPDVKDMLGQYLQKNSDVSLQSSCSCGINERMGQYLFQNGRCVGSKSLRAIDIKDRPGQYSPNSGRAVELTFVCERGPRNMKLGRTS